MVYSEYAKRILFFASQGYRPPTIVDLLRKEGVVMTHQGVRSFLLRVEEVGLDRRAESGRPRSWRRTGAVEEIVEQRMREDDETRKLQRHLTDTANQLSATTSWRCRRELGWTNRRTAYCQLVRHVNKEKRLQWPVLKCHCNLLCRYSKATWMPLCMWRYLRRTSSRSISAGGDDQALAKTIVGRRPRLSTRQPGTKRRAEVSLRPQCHIAISATEFANGRRPTRPARSARPEAPWRSRRRPATSPPVPRPCPWGASPPHLRSSFPTMTSCSSETSILPMRLGT